MAGGYARRRRAFGPPIVSYPLVQETLAEKKQEGDPAAEPSPPAGDAAPPPA